MVYQHLMGVGPAVAGRGDWLSGKSVHDARFSDTRTAQQSDVQQAVGEAAELFLKPERGAVECFLFRRREQQGIALAQRFADA